MGSFASSMRRRARSSAPGRTVAELRRPHRAVAVIRESGLFDPGWYAEQLPEPLAPGADPVEHYVRVGAAEGLSPTPLFESRWYVAQHRDASRTAHDAFTHYLLKGVGRDDAPHPLFAARQYVEHHPQARRHPGGPLGHYLQRGWREGAEPHPSFDATAYRRSHPDLTEAPFLDFARRAGRLLRETRGYGHVVRYAEAFDRDAAAEFMRRTLAEHAARGGATPLVSVVIPTKDRAEGVVAAVRSVLDQTYPHFQLVVVDDGSSDGTAEALAPYCADPRVEYVRRDVPGGVSRARNEGLARARGDYVAYLDSDNTWVPEFLEVMVAFVLTRGLRAGYCVSELNGQGRLQYRATPFSHGALRERNYIDCIVILHERSLLDEVGTFDESLRRMVDWDLLLRIADHTPLELAPFVGTSYDPWIEQDDRVTNTEPVGYLYVIKAKHMLDWAAADAGVAERVKGLTSIVIPAYGHGDMTTRCVESVYACTEGEDFEVVVVDNGSGAESFYYFQALAERFPRLRVVRSPENLMFALGSTLGALATRGDVIVMLNNDTLVEPGWLEPLVRPVAEGRAAATQPMLLYPDGTVQCAGTAFSRGGMPYHLFREFPGDAPELRHEMRRSALTAACVAVRAEDYIALRGFDPMYVNGFEDVDLCLRLAERTDGAPLLVVPESVVVHLESKTPGRGASSLENRHVFLRRWRDSLPVDDVAQWADAGYEVARYETHDKAAWEAGLPVFSPLVVRDRSPRPLRWAIKMGAPDVARRESWGDWHFANALKASLERLGHHVVIDCYKAWHRPTAHLDDVVLSLRGVEQYLPNPEHINLLWVISHPDRLGRREIGSFDTAFVASEPHAARLAAREDVPVLPLLQCTDPSRFAPGGPLPAGTSGDSEDAPRHEVLFVGNSRGVPRQMVQDAVTAGLDLAVYGAHWEGLLPEGVVRGQYLPNATLAATYRAAGVVLSDHWEDMRREGFLSNRLFDLAACGARVVSDPVPGVEGVFGDVVLCASSPGELAEAVQTQLGEGPDRAAARAELAARVCAEHSFDARAATLAEVAEKLRATLADVRPSR